MSIRNFRTQRPNVLRGLASALFVVAALLIAASAGAQTKCSRISFITPQIAQYVAGNPNADRQDVLTRLYTMANSAPGTSSAIVAGGILRSMADQRQDCLDSLR